MRVHLPPRPAMRPALLALALLATAPQAQTLGLAAPPGAETPRAGRPSAGEAYAYSAAATGGAVALGYVLYRVLPEGDPTLTSPRDAGLLLIGMGVAFGSSAGNIALEADRDVMVGLLIRTAGLGVGGGLALAAVAACSPGLGDAPASCATLGDPLFVAGAAALAVGLVGGVVYDLATIPGNARPAPARAARGGVGVGPGGVPVVGFRLDL